MSFRVTAHRRAEEDVGQVSTWLASQSLDGAARWLDAYDNMIDQLRHTPLSFGLAPENELVDSEVRQALFKTHRGRVYRAIFTIEGDNVRVLRVRSPGQGPIASDELGIA